MMATFIWRKTKGGSPSTRLLAAYVAFVLTLAVAGPGLAVYAGQGGGPGSPHEGSNAPALEAPEGPADPVAEPAVEPEPVAEPVPIPDPVVEPAPEVAPVVAPADVPVAEAAVPQRSVEEQMTVAAIVAPTSLVEPIPTADDNPPLQGGGVKIDPVNSGTYTAANVDDSKPVVPADFEIVLSVYSTDAGQVFDFESNYPIVRVVAKGSDGANEYIYDPAVVGDIYADEGLHAPVNASGYYADLSHVDFYFGQVHDSHIIVMKFRDDVVTNGEHDGGENWLAGFLFRLEKGPDSDGPWTTVEETVTVGMNGQADFGMHTTGWYRITELLSAEQIAAGETPTSGDPLGQMVFYHTGQVNSEKRFGNIVVTPPEGDIKVYKYEDLDGDGIHDDGEPMLEGWEFSLAVDALSVRTAVLPSVIATGATDVDGELIFSGLEFGDYIVTETLQPGWINTTPLVQYVTLDDDDTDCVDVDCVDPDPQAVVWFGNQRLPDPEGDLKVYKYEDLDGDGVHDDGEPMLEGWEFSLAAGLPPIGAAGAVPSVIATGATDVNGELLFGELVPGWYDVTETLKDGWTNTTPLTQGAMVVDGQTAELWFGNQRLPDPEGDLKVYKYEDLDGDGVYDDGEPMLEGWEFSLSEGLFLLRGMNVAPSVIATGATDVNGELLFGGLAPGWYDVTETLKDGWTNTTPLTQGAMVVDGQTAELWFGNQRIPDPEGDLKVYKYEDIDGDGVYDDGEPMLEGWEFSLSMGVLPTRMAATASVIATGATDVNGELLFGSLDVGQYTVTETLQDGWINTTPLAQGAAVVDGQTAELWFGNQRIPDPEGDLKVYKYEDLDGDGVYDDGEPMLEGWEFTLLGGALPVDVGAATASVIATGATDVNGELLFGSLVPGPYTAIETLQDGWINTTPLAQGAAVVDGQTAELWFGNQRIPDPEGDLKVYKYEDLDGDGVYDDGEPMLEGWEFTLSQESPPIVIDALGATAVWVVDTGMTDANGELLFSPLVPGDYIVTETLQDGWHNTTPLSQNAVVVDGETAELWFGNQRDIDEPEDGDLIVYKFEDLNENGLFDSGESMLKDWEFTLSADSSDIDSGLTDESGELFFTELTPGEYTVTETLVEGWANTTPLAQSVTVVAGETAALWFGNVEEFMPFTELDLAITKVANVDEADPDDIVSYTLTYWNNGDLVAYNFTITDDYDEDHVTVIDAAGGAVADGKITWTLDGPLAKADGKQTITYTVRIDEEMPEGTTYVDNDVVIEHPQDADESNNYDDERVIVRVPAEEEPFLPFTGGEYALLAGAAAIAAGLGTVLRFRRSRAA